MYIPEGFAKTNMSGYAVLLVSARQSDLRLKKKIKIHMRVWEMTSYEAVDIANTVKETIGYKCTQKKIKDTYTN